MKNLSIGQKKVITDFLTTISAAWVAAGIIAPVFSPTLNLNEAIPTLIISLSVAISLMVYSIMIMKGVNV